MGPLDPGSTALCGQSQASKTQASTVPPPLLAAALVSLLKEETVDRRLASEMQGGLEAVVR